MITEELKKQLTDLGYLKVVKHSTENLWIYNYTHKAQFDKEAFIKYPILQECRGLILNEENRVIARGFRKFWNYEEYGKGSILGELPTYKHFQVTDKVDGSLILVFKYNNKIIIATRGSFESEQAIIAKNILEKNSKISIHCEENRTFLFELIGNKNRIVINYNIDELLILLGVIIDNTNNLELDNRTLLENYSSILNIPIVKQFEGIQQFHTICNELPRDNAEGFVVKFDNGLRVKLKYEQYVKLHRLVTNISTTSIWESLKDKVDIEEILKDIPDEFMKEVKLIKQELETQFTTINLEANKLYNEIKNLTTRKEQALYLLPKYQELAGVVFAILNNKPYEEIIWKMIKPKFRKAKSGATLDEE